MNINPNFLPFDKQNQWEEYICKRLNERFLECRFTTSSSFENMHRHTDAFMYDASGNKLRVDFKTVKWESPTDRGANSNFSINITCFPSDNCNNPVNIFAFVGKLAEYVFLVDAKDIFTDEIIDVINKKKYGKYRYFDFNKSDRPNRKDYVVIKNEYIREKALNRNVE